MVFLGLLRPPCKTPNIRTGPVVLNAGTLALLQDFLPPEIHLIRQAVREVLAILLHALGDPVVAHADMRAACVLSTLSRSEFLLATASSCIAAPTERARPSTSANTGNLLY